MGSLNGSAKGTFDGSSHSGHYFYPSGGDSTSLKNQRFSLSRAIDFASTITTGDTGSSDIGPKAWAGNMTNLGWWYSAYRREARWNNLNSFYDFRMMDKAYGKIGSGWGDNVNNVWGSFSQSSTPSKT